MLAMTQLFSDKDDRSEEQVELLIDLVRGVPHRREVPLPDSGARSRAAPVAHHRARRSSSGVRAIASSRRLRRHLRGRRSRDARVKIIPEAGHLVGLERPEPYARAVLRFAGVG